MYMRVCVCVCVCVHRKRETERAFPGGSVVKNPPVNAGDLGSIPGLGRSSGEGKGYPLQYSGLENSMYCIVRGVTKSDTIEQLSLSPVART